MSASSSALPWQEPAESPVVIGIIGSFDAASAKLRRVCKFWNQLHRAVVQFNALLIAHDSFIFNSPRYHTLQIEYGVEHQVRRALMVVRHRCCWSVELFTDTVPDGL